MEAVSNDTNFRITATIRSLLSTFESLNAEVCAETPPSRHGPIGVIHARELYFMLKQLGENDLVWSKDVDSGKLYTDVKLSGLRDELLSALKRPKRNGENE